VTEEFVDGKRVYKGVYDNNSKNKKKRRIVQIDCYWCGEPTFATISNYKNKGNNFCSRRCASKNASEKYHQDKKTYPEPKGKISYVDKIKNNKECVRCGESHPACLDFHHKNPKNTVGNISRMKVESGYELKDIKNEIEKCIIICKNCHAKEHSTSDKDPQDI